MWISRSTDCLHACRFCTFSGAVSSSLALLLWKWAGINWPRTRQLWANSIPGKDQPIRLFRLGIDHLYNRRFPQTLCSSAPPGSALNRELDSRLSSDYPLKSRLHYLVGRAYSASSISSFDWLWRIEYFPGEKSTKHTRAGTFLRSTGNCRPVGRRMLHERGSCTGRVGATGASSFECRQCSPGSNYSFWLFCWLVR